jgi:NADPH:quinone reductase-like Zn-dependent oxidoreductase
MKAAVADRYGPAQIVQIREVPKPQPKSNEVVVRVRASSVEIADARIRGMRVPTGLSPLARLAMGLTKPNCPILGLELAGDVETVGSDVSRFKPGDRVVGSPGFRLGCHAEYCTLA